MKNYKLELLLLEIRDLIATKEQSIACANQNLIEYGGWRLDWDKACGEITEQITAKIREAREITEQKGGE